MVIFISPNTNGSEKILKSLYQISFKIFIVISRVSLLSVFGSPSELKNFGCTKISIFPVDWLENKNSVYLGENLVSRFGCTVQTTANQ